MTGAERQLTDLVSQISEMEESILATRDVAIFLADTLDRGAEISGDSALGLARILRNIADMATETRDRRAAVFKIAWQLSHP